MEHKQVLYDDIDDALDKYDHDEDLDMDVIPIGDDIFVVESPVWHVTDKDIAFIEGVYCNHSDEGGFEPDWAATLIYEDLDNIDLTKYDYFEQGTPTTAIHNYLTMKNQTSF